MQTTTDLPQRHHSETLVQSRTIGQENCQCSFEEKPEGKLVIPHSLLENGVTSGFANHQIGPLHNYNGCEEGSVTSILKILALLIGLVMDRKNK